MDYPLVDIERKQPMNAEARAAWRDCEDAFREGGIELPEGLDPFRGDDDMESFLGHLEAALATKWENSDLGRYERTLQGVTETSPAVGMSLASAPAGDTRVNDFFALLGRK